MPMLDVFKKDAFNMISLTTALQTLPFKPARIGQMGLFAAKGIRTLTAAIEEKDGFLSLLATKPRGSAATYAAPKKRTVRTFAVPHIPHEDVVYADDIEGLRAFGSETQLQAVAGVVNERLAMMRQDHEITLEHLRAGALRGSIVDSDGTTELFNLFTEFGVSETSIDFLLGTAGTDVREKVLEVVDAIEDALGAAPLDHIHCLAHKTWFRSFISHATVVDAWAAWRDGEFLRGDPRKGFPYAGVIIEEYRGKVGSVDYIPSNTARFFAVGVPNMYQTILAPANFMETVNTVGQLLYAKQERLDLDIGIRLHTQSNPLPLCMRPASLVKGHTSN